MNSQWLKCKFGRHDFYLIEKMSDYGRKLGCHYCHRLFAMNLDVRVVCPWDESFEQLYKDLAKFNLNLEQK